MTNDRGVPGGSKAICPRCNTPLVDVDIDHAPFRDAEDGRWHYLYCPGDGCAWEEFHREGDLQRWSRDGRKLED